MLYKIKGVLYLLDESPENTKIIFFLPGALSPPPSCYLCPRPFIDLKTTDQAKECVGGRGSALAVLPRRFSRLRRQELLRGKTASAGRDKGRGGRGIFLGRRVESSLLSSFEAQLIILI